MEIRDVIENMRVDILSLKLQLGSIRAEQEMLERFTWNMIRLMTEGYTDLNITIEDERPGPDASSQTLF